MSDLGQRLERYRISRNMRQDDLAQLAGLSRPTIIKLEAGAGGTIETLLRVLRAFDLGDRIVDLVPDASFSPLDPLSARGKKRQRVRKSAQDDKPLVWTWGDDDETGKGGR